MRSEIFIIGTKKLHNESLANLLSRETGLNCCGRIRLQYIQTPDDGDSVLILVDCPQKDLEKILANFERSKALVALLNVIPEKGIEEKAIVMGIRGVFYENDSLDQFRKGVRAIFNGELWLSRDIMAKCFP